MLELPPNSSFATCIIGLLVQPAERFSMVDIDLDLSFKPPGAYGWYSTLVRISKIILAVSKWEKMLFSLSIAHGAPVTTRSNRRSSIYLERANQIFWLDRAPIEKACLEFVMNRIWNVIGTLGVVWQGRLFSHCVDSPACFLFSVVGQSTFGVPL